MKPSPGIRRLTFGGMLCLAPVVVALAAPATRRPCTTATSGRKIRKTFPTLAAARTWRSDAERGVRRGTLRASAPVTVNDAADELVAAMRSGAARTRSGDPYKPSAIRSYESRARAPRPPGPRRDATRRRRASARPAPRRPARRRRPLALERPKRANAVAGDLPASDPRRARDRQPLPGSTSRRTFRAAGDRRSRRRGRARRRAPDGLATALSGRRRSTPVSDAAS